MKLEFIKYCDFFLLFFNIALETYISDTFSNLSEPEGPKQNEFLMTRQLVVAREKKKERIHQREIEKCEEIASS